MITALVVFASIFVYGLMFGITAKMFFYKIAQPHFRYTDDEKVASFFVGMFWPIGLPALLTVRDPRKGKRKSRVERRRDNELAEARHLAELAKIRSDEARYIEKAFQSNMKQNPLNI